MSNASLVKMFESTLNVCCNLGRYVMVFGSTPNIGHLHFEMAWESPQPPGLSCGLGKGVKQIAVDKCIGARDLWCPYRLILWEGENVMNYVVVCKHLFRII